METKKNHNKDYRKKHTLFFQIGLAFSIGVSLFAFSWQKTLYEDVIIRDTMNDVMEFLPPLDNYKKEEEKQERREEEPPRRSNTFVEGDQTDTVSIVLDTFGPPLPPVFDTVGPPLEVLDTTVYEVVPVPPVFPGGQEALDNYFRFNFRMPSDAARVGAVGKIFIEFVVNEEGKMTDIRIASDAPGWGCGEEALRVIKKMAGEITWKPGEYINKKVKVRYRYPIVITTGD